MVEEIRNILESEPITMEESSHTYYYDGFDERQTFMSQSAVVELLQKPFDEEKMSLRCSRNPEHEYYGYPPEEIKTLWREKNLKSRIYGSSFHNYVEDDLLGKEGLIENGIESIVTAYHDFKDKLLSKLTFVHAENLICHPDYQVAGTYDYMGLYKDQLFMLDWKTNSKFNCFGGYKFKPPFSNLANDKWTLYSLQAAIYKFIIEDRYGLELPHARIVWFKDQLTHKELTAIASVTTDFGEGWVTIKPRYFPKTFIKELLNYAISHGL